MNDLGVLLIGLAARGVLFASLGLLLAWTFRRRGPAAGSAVALAALTGLLGLAALSMSPWPRWWHVEGETRESKAEGRMPEVVAGAARPEVEPSGGPSEGVDRARAASGGPWLRDFVEALEIEMSRPTAGATDHSGWRWPSWVVVGFAIGAVAGMARLGIGLRAVAALRRSSRPVLDGAMIEMMEILRAELSCLTPVELRETTRLTTPATVGWRRPVVLLPGDWQAWTDAERRAVLAHELAHVRRGDYLAGLWAQVCLVVHFYNPLAHGLARRLRLQQELAADALGASLSGGNRAYLATLARMALRCDERSVGWPARAFLPARDTFLRRIQMLRDVKDTRPAPFPRRARLLTLGTMSATMLAVAGLRGPVAPEAIAQESPPATKPAAPGADPQADRLAHVPAEAEAVISLRLAEVVARPEFQPMLKDLKPLMGSLVLPIEQIEQLTLVWLPRSDARPGQQPLDVMIVQATGPQDWEAFAGKLVGDLTPVEFGGRTYFRSRSAPAVPGYLTLDDRTYVIGTEPTLQRYITSLGRERPPQPWRTACESLGTRGQVIMAFNSDWLIRQLDLARGGRGPNEIELLVGPLLNKAFAHAMSLELIDGVQVEAVSTCGSDEGAEQVAATEQALLTLARNALQTLRSQAPNDLRLAPPEALLAGVADPLLKQARVEAEGPLVRLSSKTDVDFAAVVKTLTPPLMAARQAARRAQSVNNMKQIALAMHNYNQVNGHFPPAVVMGPDGKTPHSWRVALLPFLEQQPLYEQYHFDEPWDSPANKTVLETMPSIYRVPQEGPQNESNFADYYVLTGGGSMFSAKDGVKFEDVSDGTSNTIMVVEAKREIPWTKPEDIAYRSDGSLPKFGGYFDDGFNAAFADGSVKFLKDSIDEKLLRALITMAGGEVFDAGATIPQPTAR